MGTTAEQRIVMLATNAAIKWEARMELFALVGATPELANAKDENGYTPLHMAAATGCVATVDFLIEHGAAVNASSAPNSFTPLISACAACKPAVAIRLLAAGARVNDGDGDGDTPLHIVMCILSTNEYEVGEISSLVYLLFTHGADANARNNERKTPYHVFAAIRGLEANEKTLIGEQLKAAGAADDAQDENGKTPADLLEDETDRMAEDERNADSFTSRIPAAIIERAMTLAIADMARRTGLRTRVAGTSVARQSAPSDGESTR